MGKNAVVLLSGGLDSSTLLFQLKAQGFSCETLAVHYGQRHWVELRNAEIIAARAEVPHLTCDLGTSLAGIFSRAQSSQVGIRMKVPEGHYAAENMKTTVVPGRNALLLSTAAAFASAQNATFVAYAAHAGDHPIYPDCRPDFAAKMGEAFELGYGIQLLTPFIHMTKAEIVQLGSTLGVPFGLTRSCYTEERLHCGRCGTCVERKEAFRLAQVVDPTGYDDPAFMVEAFRGQA